MTQPFDYLIPDRFKSKFNLLSNADYAKNQYIKGRDIGKEAHCITIAINGVWSAQMKDGGNIQSYERIGYHAHTETLLQGFLDSGCEIFVYTKDERVKIK